LSFTIFDPVGLGQNFAALMHLADYEESAINSRIWTQTAQFEEKLAELNEHMEKVIQMYLRNEYATIAEYNAEAGTMAEKYHFLVIASFPVNFSDTAARRLRNIAASGARCGVYVFIQWDQRTPLPQDLCRRSAKKTASASRTRRGFKFTRQPVPGAALSGCAAVRRVRHRIPAPSGRQQKLHPRRSAVLADRPARRRSGQETTVEELRVPIGRSAPPSCNTSPSARAPASTRSSRAKPVPANPPSSTSSSPTSRSGAAPTRSSFISSISRRASNSNATPSRRLPHARVVAIESDRAFGLSVLQRVDEELRRRGDLFRQVGAQDLAGYHRAGGAGPAPLAAAH
jgi:S-DNA-T family DNA segregation ATPase FtsK/SpoIIIE